MSTWAPEQARRIGRRYGTLAFGSIVLACYGGLLSNATFYASPWMVPVVFALGAVYTVLGILGGFADCERGAAMQAMYYLVQLLVLTAIMVLSPLRGFLGIMSLPLVSQAIFDLRPRYAVAIAGYLFAVTVAVWGLRHGWSGARDAGISYATAFIFTGVFTFITKQAVVGRRTEQRLRQEVEEANRRLREHAAQAEELATTRERNRVAREIHDGVGHYLTVVKTQLDAAAALLPAQPERAREAVTKAARLAGEALDDVRRSVGALRTDVARPPLPEALCEMAREAGLPVTVRVEGAARALAPAAEHALFRSAQEGLTNVRKHAGASAVDVVLDFEAGGRVRLAITDDGRGVNGAGGVNGGFGLKGIRERIEVLGGRVASGNREGGGFALTVEVPA
jgi:signal transduction histidine kinase